jgi:hypothetical protein
MAGQTAKRGTTEMFGFADSSIAGGRAMVSSNNQIMKYNHQSKSSNTLTSAFAKNNTAEISSFYLSKNDFFKDAQHMPSNVLLNPNNTTTSTYQY